MKFEIKIFYFYKYKGLRTGGTSTSILPSYTSYVQIMSE